MSLEARFRSAIGALDERGAAGIDEMLEAYDADVVFEDPMQRVEGREAFGALNRRLFAHSKSIRFELHEVVEAGDRLFATWTMHVEPKLGPKMRIPGSTFWRARDGKVVEHRDYWDLLSSVAETIPGAAAIYRAVLRRLA